MKSADGATVPLWTSDVTIPKFPPPKADGTTDVDVCVVGAGIAGLTVAYLAAQKGLSVAVFDEGQIDDGQTARTSAHLSSAIDDRFYEIERLRGQKASQLAYESHSAAIDTIEKIAKSENIECDFARLNGFLSRHPDDPKDILEKELAAAQRAGFADIEMVQAGGMYPGPAIRFGNQARFHPMKYMAGLAKALEAHGGNIFCGRRVMDVQGVDPKKRTPGRVKLQGLRKTVAAKHVVVATNTPAPINSWFGIYTKQSAYRTYVIVAPVPKGAIADALYWDTADPYHYVRLEPGRDEDLLIIGGEDHKTGQFPDSHSPFIRLQDWAQRTFSGIGQVKFRWSGQVQEPADGLGFIGRAVTDKEEVFVVTGDSGMGLTHGTIAGLLINDQIAGRQNPWEELYDPSRKMLNQTFLKENANVVAQYRDLITPGDVKTEADVPNGHGAILREGLSKVAVFRDNAGKVHKCSAVCTHLECIVRWNDIEGTWDCPCHGSRFDAKGKVLMGPAIDDLPPVK